MRLTYIMAAAFGLSISSPAHASSFFVEIEQNDTLETAQLIDAGLGGSTMFGSAFIDGVVEGNATGLFDFFAFEVLDFNEGLSFVNGGVYATGLNAATGEMGDVPLVTLFDEFGTVLGSNSFAKPGRYIVGVGRDEGSTATSYRLVLSAFAVPEPSTWALLTAGFGLVGYTMRRRRGVMKLV